MADQPTSLVIHGRPTSVGTYQSRREPRDISSADLQCVAGVPPLGSQTLSLSHSTTTTINQPLHINTLWSNHNSTIQQEKMFPTKCAVCSHFYAVFAHCTVTIFYIQVLNTMKNTATGNNKLRYENFITYSRKNNTWQKET